MRFTDIFIRRPVLATVVSLLIVVLGLMAFRYLPVRLFPEVQFAEVNISASLSGASATAMQAFVATPIQDAISRLDNIDYITASSHNGGASIHVQLFPGTDADNMVSQIVSKIQQIKGDNLPAAMEEPTIQKGEPGSERIMYLAFYSDSMSAEQIGDYATRILLPKLQAVPGVASASSLGARTYSMRLWLDPRLMAAKGVQALDITTALSNNNTQSSAGSLIGKWNVLAVQTTTGLHTVDQFNNMIIKTYANGDVVRLKDIGYAKLGAKNTNNQTIVNGKQAVLLQITNKTSANPLDVTSGIQKILPQLFSQLPPSLKGEVLIDNSVFIKESIHTVLEAIIEAILIVILVIFLSLGSFRTVLIPMVTIPVSLIGVLAAMMALGYSLNVLTLLAMVLAIGLVVDDAIVVVENISRHLEEGMSPWQASILGAREIASPVIAMTITLAAVFLPIGFSGGVSGALFTEFAFTLACSVILSGVVALTLTPMMSARILSQKQLNAPFVKRVDHMFHKLSMAYQRALRAVLEIRFVVVIIAAVILVSCFYLYSNTPSEIAPDEDQSLFYTQASGPVNANIDYVIHYMKQVTDLLKPLPGIKDTMIINGQGGQNESQVVMVLKPKAQRELSQMQLVNRANQVSRAVPGMTSNAFNPPVLPGGDFGMPVNFVLTSAGSYQTLYDVAEKIIAKARKSGLFVNLSNSLTLNRPSLDVDINRDKAAQMGITSAQIGSALGVMFSNGHTDRFDMDGRNYYVVAQAYDKFRLTPKALEQIYLTSTALDADGNPEMVSLANFVTLKRSVQPSNLPQFQRLNSATINAQMAPGYTLSDGLNYLAKVARANMPSGMTYDYTGASRQFVQEGGRMLIIFGFALIIIFLVLAAQFESFRDPFIILISVPLSLFGALVPLNIGLGTINLFTQIGLLTLVGLITKHGILIVQFANQAQEQERLSVKEAVIKGATLRLRPILMTTAAMVLGVAPLLFSSEGLANSQRDIAMVIFCGMLVGTCFTLFVVPTIYSLIGHKRSKPERIAHETFETN